MKFVRNILENVEENKMENNDILLVKNYQSDETIRKMYEKSFGKILTYFKISRLSGGLKNAVYLIEDSDKKIVLKIAPKDENKMVTLDRNILWWEAEVLKLIGNLEIKVPTLLNYDDSLEICDSPYIFMTYIDGENFLDNRKKLSSFQIERIEYELGEISSKLCSIKRDKFFLPCQPDATFSNNYEFISNLFRLLLNDATSKQIIINKTNFDDIMNLIEVNKDHLNNISNICLAHCDLWDGNVLVNDGKLSGILDFSDAYFCDELMTFYFHTVDGITSKHFLKGFNKKELNYDEKVRIEIYRLYVLLKMIIDVEFKGYGKYNWMYEEFDNQYKKIKKLK